MKLKFSLKILNILKIINIKLFKIVNISIHTYIHILGFIFNRSNDFSADSCQTITGASHGPGEVHQEVQVHGVVLGQSNHKGDVNRFTGSRFEEGVDGRNIG